MINNTVLTGRLTKDPELRYTGNGTAVVQFNLAVDRAYTNAQGERETDFIRVVAWKKQAETIANHVKKGSLVGIEGRIQTRTYDDNDGKRVYITEVVSDKFTFLESKSSNNQNNQQSNNYSQNSNQGNYGNDPFDGNNDSIDISDDDLPF